MWSDFFNRTWQFLAADISWMLHCRLMKLSYLYQTLSKVLYLFASDLQGPGLQVGTSNLWYDPLSQKKYVCVLCEKRFDRRGKLEQHMRIHNGEKPFACMMCSYRSNQNCNLRKHMRRTHQVNLAPRYKKPLTENHWLLATDLFQKQPFLAWKWTTVKFRHA